MQIRIFIDYFALHKSTTHRLNEQHYHYLRNVLRVSVQQEIMLYNQLEGEFRAKVISIKKNHVEVTLIEQINFPYTPPNISVVFSVVKNAIAEQIAKQATQLGVVNFYPVIMDNSAISKLNIEKFRKNTIEASEQSHRLDIPKVHAVTKLDDLLHQNIDGRVFILLDERLVSSSATQIIADIRSTYSPIDLKMKEIITIIGPEGGFSSREFDLFQLIPDLYSMSLGSRILRIETAIIASLTLIQSNFGDW